MWLANRLHLWAERIYPDWHTVKLTNKHDGSQVSFSCHWQWTGSWMEADYHDDCSCENEPASALNLDDPRHDANVIPCDD